MMGHRERLICGDEYDVVCRKWRKMLCYLDKPGMTRFIKRKMARRARRDARLAAALEARGMKA